MLQKSLRGLTPTTFWLTPEALTATLLLKMNRGVLDVAQMWVTVGHPDIKRLNTNCCQNVWSAHKQVWGMNQPIWGGPNGGK